MTYKFIPITILAVIATTGKLDAQILQSVPKLMVNITIDQLRTDYLEAFSPLYGNGGFKKLLDNGVVYTNASYPFSPIDRASAIATISTGTTPYYNSIIGEKWLDKETLRPHNCVDDINYNGYLTDAKSSPANILSSTLSDELKVATSGKAIVYAIAPFREAAIISAGHAADGAIWIDDINGQWCSSTYYFAQLPSWISAYQRIYANTFVETEWKPINELSGNFSYFLSGGMQSPFNHKFKDDNRYIKFKTSGLVNESITDISLQCLNSTGIGIDNITDLLNITYYAGCYDSKPVAECQMEIQDTYVRLDKSIENLIRKIEERFGSDKVLFCITSTGYFNDGSADYSQYRIPSGTFNITRNANLLNMYLGAIWGQAQYVEACFGAQIYLNHKLLEQKRISLTDVTQRAQEFISMLSGVRNVYTAQQILSGNNQNIFKIRNGFHPDRNGDIIIDISPGWKLLNEETNENFLSRASYIQFPIIIYGANVKSKRISTLVYTDRIAPTISKAIRIRAPNACSSEPLF